MSDCEKCWSHVCECGWDWAQWSPDRLKEISDVLLLVRDLRTQYPAASRDDIYAKVQAYRKPGP